MKQLFPYLIFTGQCSEALAFYKKCFDGEIVSMQTFAESPLDVPNEHKARIFNSVFQADGIHFMASDSIPPYEIVNGNNFSMFIKFSDKGEQERVFNMLFEGGKVIMPLENNFGMLMDKYGIQWMLSL